MTGTTTSQRRISVFLLDDHEAARRGLRDLLTEQADMDVVGDAATAAVAREQILALRPDVAIIDVRLPDGDGTSVCRDVRSMLPDTSVLMLMGAGDDASLAGSIMAGAAGCMLKRSSGPDLVDAVRTVAAGLPTLDHHAARLIIARTRMHTAEADRIAALTDQERRVLQFIADGLTNRQIAHQMSLTERTVKNYVASVLSKLGMHRRAQAAAFVVRSGLAERRRAQAIGPG